MIECILLTALVWLAYGATLKSGFVIDDIDGIEHYDGKLKKLDYGHLSKWLIFKAFGKNHFLHHLLSVVLHNLCVVSLYSFLSNMLPYNIALLTSSFFALHPITHQGVAWVSGRGYSIGLLFFLLSTNIYTSTTFFHSNPLLFTLILIVCSALYYVAVNAQFTLLMSPFIMLAIGNYPLAVLFTIVSIYCGRGIVKEVIGIRTKTFKEQNLGHMTSLKIKKIFVAAKTLAYYTLLILFPKRLGLYHTFHYHYSEKTEKFDFMCVLGMLIVVLCGVLFFLGSPAIKLAVIWYLFYTGIFLNWITIQQFIAERYVHISSIGIFILMSIILQYAPILAIIILSLYLSRTWNQIPAYENEITYYQSNIWNFPTSEVAFANLGVCYLRTNMMGSAVDMWTISTKLNPEYDVAYYNIASVMKQSNNLKEAHRLLKKAVDSPGCHFKELWSGELKALEHEIAYQDDFNATYSRVVEMSKDPQRKEVAQGLLSQLNEINNLHKRLEAEKKIQLDKINSQKSNLEQQLADINNHKSSLETPLPLNKLVEMRDKNFIMVKEVLNKI